MSLLLFTLIGLAAGLLAKLLLPPPRRFGLMAYGVAAGLLGGGLVTFFTRTPVDHVRVASLVGTVLALLLVLGFVVGVRRQRDPI